MIKNLIENGFIHNNTKSLNKVGEWDYYPVIYILDLSISKLCVSITFNKFGYKANTDWLYIYGWIKCR